MISMFDNMPPGLFEIILLIVSILVIGTAVIAGFIVYMRIAFKYRDRRSDGRKSVEENEGEQ